MKTKKTVYISLYKNEPNAFLSFRVKVTQDIAGQIISMFANIPKDKAQLLSPRKRPNTGK